MILIDNATSNTAEKSKRDFKETATTQIKKLVQILLEASKKGVEYFDKVVNDPDVQGILERTKYSF